MKIRLYWVNFYEQMDCMGMDGQYREFDRLLTDMFCKQFNRDDIEIEWMD